MFFSVIRTSRLHIFLCKKKCCIPISRYVFFTLNIPGPLGNWGLQTTLQLRNTYKSETCSSSLCMTNVVHCVLHCGSSIEKNNFPIVISFHINLFITCACVLFPTKIPPIKDILIIDIKTVEK